MNNIRDDIHKYIPGGCHTYSRGDDAFPSNVPDIIVKGKGCKLYDLNDNEYIDYGMACRAIAIGYAEEEIDDSAIAEIKKGNNLTRASLTEYETAKKVINLIDYHDMVKFAKNGSNITTAAVKLSRGYTGKKHFLYCKNHPFFSFDDWFIGTTPANKGIPENLCEYGLPFEYGNIESVRKYLRCPHLKDDISCIILEPIFRNIGNYFPYKSEEELFEFTSNFLKEIRKFCDENKIILILDEMITGFRFHIKGAGFFFGVESDLSCWGKACSNGYSLSFLTGKRKIMEIGGIKNIGEDKLFLLSTTHGGEMSSFGALSATIDFYLKNNVIEKLNNTGRKIIKEFTKITSELGMEEYFQIYDFPCCPNFDTRNEKKEKCMKFRTLFLEKMMENKIFMPYISICYHHDEETLEKTFSSFRETMKTYKKAIEEGIEKYLHSEPIKPVFRKKI